MSFVDREFAHFPIKKIIIIIIRGFPLLDVTCEKHVSIKPSSGGPRTSEVGS